MADDEKLKKKHWLKGPKAVPKSVKLGPKYEWFVISYLEFFFWKYYFKHTTFLYLSRLSSGHHQGFFNFIFSSRKSQSQQKPAKKTTHFTIQFLSKNLIHFANLNSPDPENNMLAQHSQKPFWLYKFSGKHISVWCQKKYLHCTISWRTRTAFLKHFESKCLYISIYLLILEIQFFILIEIFENSTIF